LLQGAGPWNLELQIIGPQQAEILQIQGIETPKKTIQIPIPKDLLKSGGSFEIALGNYRPDLTIVSCTHGFVVSVEDTSKCKRPVSVPGVEVKVKRVVVSTCTI